ncbi:unnamed protein product (macronuclear) [Paramecium tetraurelia]|uniref:Uncharacterized protein n=1 Tax=Paramecium tetraurelia TaxID=5888 RepID=A0BDS7_PARTE|nr:uncharacterized protein GSPATT00027724001 [Paramecium tetraurelia]CAK56694.1 unnamed protein product [Paramecium tetraurelia]|eukprot:XP_001424092.1 hypothetical protein (macronuclear) [Paramecium tetraurelia strain d4-2]
MSDQFHQLSDKWTISEKYTQNKDDDYKKTIAEICSIRSVEEFAFIMKQTIYQSLTDLFSEPQQQKQFKNFKNNAIETQIEAIQFFKNGISPLWEDPENEKGGDIQFEVPIALIGIYNQLYTEIIHEIIGQQKEELRHVNGVRVLDKINAPKGNGIRIELWLDIDPTDKNEEVQIQIKKIDDWILQLAELFDIRQLKLKTQSHKKK